MPPITFYFIANCIASLKPTPFSVLSFGYAVEPKSGTEVIGSKDGFSEHKGPAKSLFLRRRGMTAREGKEAAGGRMLHDRGGRQAGDCCKWGGRWGGPVAFC